MVLALAGLVIFLGLLFIGASFFSHNPKALQPPKTLHHLFHIGKKNALWTVLLTSLSVFASPAQAFTCSDTTLGEFDSVSVRYTEQACADSFLSVGYQYRISNFSGSNFYQVRLQVNRPGSAFNLVVEPIVNSGPCVRSGSRVEFTSASSTGSACNISLDYAEFGRRLFLDFTIARGVGSGSDPERVFISNIVARDLTASMNLPASHDGAPFNATLTFSENMTGVEAGDFSVTNGTVTALSGSGMNYNFTVTPSSGDADVLVRLLPRTSMSNQGGVNPGIPTQTVVANGNEIEVEGNSNVISNGDTTPTPGDDTDFGSLDVTSGSATSTFTIKNSGSVPLAVSSVSISDTTNYAITQPNSPIVASGSETFTVTYDPTTSGAHPATVTINNNDADENPYTFAVTGSGTTGPEIKVEGNSVDIVDGDTTPSLADHSDFGDVDISSSGGTRIFTVRNTGDTTLTFTSPAAMSNPRFSVSTPLPASIPPGGSAPLGITFTTNAVGTSGTTLRIFSDDADEATFNFRLGANGSRLKVEVGNPGSGNAPIANGAAASTSLGTDFGAVEVNGGQETSQVRIHNVQGSTKNLTFDIPSVTITGPNAADFSITNAPSGLLAPGAEHFFNITFDPSALGTRTAQVTIHSDNPEAADYSFSLAGVGQDVEISVAGNGNNIPSGDFTPSAADHTDFGAVDSTSSTAITRIFTVSNTGQSPLIISNSVVASGYSGTAQSPDYAITTALPGSIPGGGSAQLGVTFTPGPVGDVPANIRIFSNDSDEPLFNFGITTFGEVRAMEISTGNSPSAAVPHNGPIATNTGTDFGSVLVPGGTANSSFRIHLAGFSNTNLTLGTPALTITGPNASDFTVSQDVSGSLSPGDSMIFIITFDPSAVGTRNAVVTINSNFATYPAYAIPVQGVGLAGPEVDVKGNGVSISDGDSTPSTLDDTDFGSTPLIGGTVAKTFTIENTGDFNLTLGTPSSSHADFTITANPTSPVGPSGTTTFTVTFDPSTPGATNATISFTNDDPDENPYDFVVTGSGNVTPEINVKGNGNTILDGNNVPSAANNTDFGTTTADVGMVARVFTIENTGTGPLAIASITSSVSDYTISGAPTTIASASSATFTVTFDPSIGGQQDAQIIINNSDVDEATYEFRVTGKGNANWVNGAVNVTIPTDGKCIVGPFANATATNIDVSASAYNAAQNAGDGIAISKWANGASVANSVQTFANRPTGANNGLNASVSIATTDLIGNNAWVALRDQFNDALGRTDATPPTSATNVPNDGFGNFHYTAANMANDPDCGPPEIEVTGNGNSIADGASGSSSSNHTIFPNTDVAGSTSSRTYQIENVGTGTGVLTLGAVTIGGPNASDFTVTTTPTGPIAPGGAAASLTIQFDPSASGTRTATVSIVNNDSDENPYNFTITGNGTTAPEIEITGNGAPILSGSTTTSAANHTDFGEVAGDNDSRSRTYTINNTGLGTLNVGPISIFGTGAPYYTVTTPPSSTVAPGGSTTVVITFDPPGNGETHEALIFVPNNDSDEGSFNFKVSGTARHGWRNLNVTLAHVSDGVCGAGPFANATSAAVSISGSGEYWATLGSSTLSVYRWNQFSGSFGTTSAGGVTPSGSAPFPNVSSVSGTDTIPASRLIGTNAYYGLFGRLSVAGYNSNTSPSGPPNNPANNSSPSNKVGGVQFIDMAADPDCGPAEIEVTGNGNLITDGDTATAATNHTEFPDAAVAGGTSTRSFSIDNVSNLSGDLTLGAVTISGANAGDFTVTATPTGPISSGGSAATLTIQFDPSAAGVRSAIVSIVNNDADENPYDFAVTGTGTVAPEAEVEGNGVVIADGDTTPSAADHTDFGSTAVSGGTIVRSFTVKNLGDAALTLGTPSSDNAVFTIGGTPATSIAPNGSTTFTVTFDPAAAGAATATISFSNNDADENPYDFAVTGTGTVAPEAEVEGNGVVIADGDTTPSAADHTDFGSTAVSGGTVVRSFTVKNLGDAALTLGTPSSDNAVFTIGGTPATSIAPNGSTTFTVTFDPAAAGAATATISFSNNDADENPYDFAVTGTGTVAPEAEVEGNGVVIADGDTTPSAADHTDFGSTAVSGGTVVRSFTVKNLGDAALTLGTPSSDNAVFTIGGTPATSIAPNGSTTFTVTFDPAAAGAATATISFSNNDADENPYDFAVTGTGTASAAPIVSITGLPASFTDLTPIVVTLTFDQNVNGFTATDLVVSGAVASGFGGGPSVWTVTLTPSGTGNISLSIPASVATNNGGTGNKAASAQSIFDTVVETSDTIAGFMSQRAAALLGNQPDITLLGQPGQRRFEANLTRNRLSFAAASLSNSALWYQLNGSISVLGTSEQEYLFGAIGTQRDITPSTTVGVMFQFDHVKQRDGVARVEGRGALVGPYFVTTLQNHPITIDGRLLWGKSVNEISPFGTYTDRFETERLLATLDASGELIYDSVTISPRIGLSYVSDRQESYVDALSNVIPSQRVTLTNLSMGADWSMPIPVSRGSLLFTGGISAIWTSGSPSASDLLDGGRGQLELGFDYRASDQTTFKVSARVDGIGNSGFESYGIAVEFEHNF